MSSWHGLPTPMVAGPTEMLMSGACVSAGSGRSTDTAVSTTSSSGVRSTTVASRVSRIEASSDPSVRSSGDDESSPQALSVSKETTRAVRPVMYDRHTAHKKQKPPIDELSGFLHYEAEDWELN